MSHSSSRRAPTPFHHTDSRPANNRASRSSGSSRASISSRSSASTAISSWIDEVSSRSSSPSPSEWVIPGAPHLAATQASRQRSPNTGHTMPPFPFPTQSNDGGYPPAPPTAPYAPPPPPSAHGSVSSRRTSSSTPTRRSSSTRHRQAEPGGQSTGRTLDTIPCQVCLQPATVCTCQGDKTALLRMREAALQVINPAGSVADSGSTRGQNYQGPPQVVPQLGGPGSGYAQGMGYGPGYGAPVSESYAGSSVSAHSGRASAMGGYGTGYYDSPVVVPPSQSSGWGGAQQDLLGPGWGVRRG